MTTPLQIEAMLWSAANKLRGNMDSAEYKHVVLGLIFLKYVSDAFDERREELAVATADPSSDEYLKNPAHREELLESRDEYLAAGVFWVPSEARWTGIQSAAKLPDIGGRIDVAMDAIERENASLRGVLPKNYARQELDVRRLGELVDLIGNIGLGTSRGREGDLLGRVYEYFLGQFAANEGKGGGEFYTPRSVVRLLVEMLEPFKGRVYDPCAGSGGMFVQAEDFVIAHGGTRDSISVYGQESNATTWRIAKMNLALRGIEANLAPEWGDTFHDDKHPDLRADFILANPPFNISEWGELLREDKRWQFGTPPSQNANYAWLQHIASKLAPKGVAGVVLANGSLSSNSNGEGEMRKAMVEADLVECMVALPPQLFYSTGIPVCLWFLNRDKAADTSRRQRDLRGGVLFIDARQMGTMVTRVHRELTHEDLKYLAGLHRSWKEGTFEDVPGIAASVSTDVIRDHGYVLTPGRYVGNLEEDPGETTFSENLRSITDALLLEMDRNVKMDEDVRSRLMGLTDDD